MNVTTSGSVKNVPTGSNSWVLNVMSAPILSIFPSVARGKNQIISRHIMLQDDVNKITQPTMSIFYWHVHGDIVQWTNQRWSCVFFSFSNNCFGYRLLFRDIWSSEKWLRYIIGASNTIWWSSPPTQSSTPWSPPLINKQIWYLRWDFDWLGYP